MPQIPAEKSYFTFQAGLNTDASYINFPDESTSDEQNFEMLRDGSRRRRKGLALESGGSHYTLTNTLGTSDVVKSYRWRNAGGQGSDFIVIQSGSDLYFFQDTITPSAVVDNEIIDLTVYKVSGKADTDVSQNPVSMVAGRNRLIVSAQYVEPFHIEWDGTNFSTVPIKLRERDFFGVDDGVSPVTEPTALSNSHEYNLRNAGWKKANITTYQSSKSKYPSTNMYPWKGYRRANVTGKAESDGTWEFSADKMESELFGDTSAVKGHFIINPFDTEYTGTGSAPYSIDGITTDWSSAGSTVTINIDSHGLTGAQTFFITGNSYFYAGSLPVLYYGSLDGEHSATYSDGDNYTISVSAPPNYSSSEAFSPLGQVVLTGDAELMQNSSPFTTSERPQQVQWYAGRVWYFGIDDPKLADRVYFSKIIEDETEFGQCYQKADPTDVEFNELVASDGGVIVVPDLGTPYGSVVYDSYLLIFTENGVWQIQGGNNQVFTAETYSIRKLSDFAATSPYGVVKGGDTVYWTGHEGIHRIFRDPQTGFLTSDIISGNRVQTLWNGLGETEQRRVKLEYDKAQKRIYILYQTTTGYNTAQYDATLVWDTRLQAFYKLVFPTAAANYITHLFNITSTEEGENNKNIKFAVQTSTRTKLSICDMDQTDFTDFDSAEQLPYMVTGYDNLSDFQRTKQAPVIHVFCAKTETGYTSSGTDLVPTNESSVLLRSIWDWSDNSNSGKFGSQKEVYRHRRYYQPTGASDTFDDGFPVVVTRNKLRGRGKVLHLRFDGATGKDAHILGWSIQYRATRNA